VKDAAFVPFFGVPAATLLAPSRMARTLDMAGAAGGGGHPARRPGLARALPAAAGGLPQRRPAGRRRAHERLRGDRRSCWTRRSTCGCTSASSRARRGSRRCTTRRAG
jgi:hypothetical protein